MHVRALLVLPVLAASTLLLAQSPMPQSPLDSGPAMTASGQPGFVHGMQDLGILSGSLVTLDGRPVREAQVELHDVTKGTVIASGYTGTAGTFEFENVPLGQYEVVATRGVDQAHERVRVEHGPTQVTLRINTPQSEPGSGNTVSVAALKVPDKANDEFRKAEEAFNKNKMDEAEKHNEKVLSLVPNYAQALTMRGLLQLSKGDAVGGTQSFQAAIHADPNYALAYFAIGAALNGEGSFADAQKSLEQGLRIEPTSWQGYFELSKAVLGQHDFRNALKYVVKSESLGGAYPPIHLVKAHALLGLKDYDEAATELEQYLAKEATGPKAEEARKTLSQAKAFSATAEK
jgi:Tfp pilus assembly protein PilF